MRSWRKKEILSSIFDNEYRDVLALCFLTRKGKVVGNCSGVEDVNAMLEGPEMFAPPPDLKLEDMVPDFKSWINSYFQQSAKLVKERKTANIPFGMVQAPRTLGTVDQGLDGVVTIIASDIPMRNHWTIKNGSFTKGPEVVYNGYYDRNLLTTLNGIIAPKDQHYFTALEGVSCNGSSWHLAGLMAVRRVRTNALFSGAVTRMLGDGEYLLGPVTDTRRKLAVALGVGMPLIGNFMRNETQLINYTALINVDKVKPTLPVLVQSEGSALFVAQALLPSVPHIIRAQAERMETSWNQDERSLVSEELRANIRRLAESNGRSQQGETLIANAEKNAAKNGGRMTKVFFEGTVIPFIELGAKKVKIPQAPPPKLNFNSVVYVKGEGKGVYRRVTDGETYSTLYDRFSVQAEIDMDQKDKKLKLFTDAEIPTFMTKFEDLKRGYKVVDGKRKDVTPSFVVSLGTIVKARLDEARVILAKKGKPKTRKKKKALGLAELGAGGVMREIDFKLPRQPHKEAKGYVSLERKRLTGYNAPLPPLPPNPNRVIVSSGPFPPDLDVDVEGLEYEQLPEEESGGEE